MKRLSMWALALGAGLVGCAGSQTATEDATSAVSQALDPAANSSDAVEAAGLMRGPQGLRLDAVEGFRCDDSPEITYVDVCGKPLPATVHLEWTACAAPSGHGGHGGPRPGPGDGGEPRPPPDGGVPPGPGPGHGPGGGGHGGPPGGGHGGAGDGGMLLDARRDGPGRGPSDGVVDIQHTYATPDGCDGAISDTQAVTFKVTRTGADGSTASSEGTATSTSTLLAGVLTGKRTELDVTRAHKDATGALLRQVHLTGTREVAFSGDAPPTRTSNGSFTEEHSDGTVGTVKETNVVRPPMSVCPFPTAGMLERTLRDGTSHVLVYGPDCGSATLDGVGVELPDHRGGPGGGGRR